MRPVASPIDTFIRPQEPSRDTSLQDLARSLSVLGGSLGEYVGKRDKEAEEADKVRGEAAFWQANGIGSAEAVSTGLIPAQASPALVRAYKRLEGEVAGGQLEQKFSAAYDAWEGKSSTDPAAYDAFVGSFIRDAIKTDDPDILRGLLPKIHQVSANFLQRHIGDASKATMSGATTALAAKQDQLITDANSAGLASKAGTDYPGVFSRLEAIRAEGLGSGMDAEAVDRKLVDTITAKAVSLRDPKLLDFLERTVPGKDYSWSATPYGRDAKDKTIETLEAMGRRSIAEDEQRRRQEKAALKDDVTRRTIAAITAQPNEPIPEDLLAAGEKVDPDFRVNAITWRDKIGKGAQASDPEDLYRVTADILSGGGLQVVQRAMTRGAFRNAEDLTRAWKLAESMQSEGPALDAVMKGHSAKIILDTIKVRTAGKKDGSKYFDDGSVSPEGLQGQLDFKLQILAWRKAHPEADIIAQETAVNDIGASILKRIMQPEFMGPLGYERGGIESPNVYGAAEAPKPAQPSKPTAPPKSSAPAASPPVPETDAMGNPLGGAAPDAGNAPSAPAMAPAPSVPQQPTSPPDVAADAADWFNRQPPDVRQALERKAAAERKPLSLKTQEVFDRGVKAGRITVKPVDAPAAAAPAIPEAATVRPEPTPGTAEKSQHLQELERQYRRPGAKRPLSDFLSNPLGAIFDDRPRAPWWPKKKQEGEDADDKFGAMRAPDGTPIETASASGEAIGRAFGDAIDAPPPAERVRLLGEAFERALAATGKPAGGYVAVQLRDDPKAARILDFVAGPESGGNYNAFFGNSRSTRDLSVMTLDQVVSWSRTRGTPSSATGRYQFLAGTLQGLKGEIGLSGSERFTPELQDRLALRLLERRGYAAWQAGKLSAVQFANNLALEWAALPNITPQRGRPAGSSAYAGDGLNKSTVSPGSVMAALSRAAGGPGSGEPAARPGILSRLAAAVTGRAARRDSRQDRRGRDDTI